MGRSEMEAKVLPLNSGFYFQEQPPVKEDQNEYNGLKQKFAHYRIIKQLQKSIVRQNMHNAMSPLSAISGYLELIDLSLNDNADIHQIDYYRKKIESGVKEVNSIIEQLQQVYSEESDLLEEGEELLVVDLNWMVRDVCNEMHLENSELEMEIGNGALHITTDLYVTKLILFKMISYATKCSSSKDIVRLRTLSRDEMATFAVYFNVSECKSEEIDKIVQYDPKQNPSDLIKDNSMNEGLFASTRLVKQVGGHIAFKRVDNDRGKLELSLPLC
ncbi:HAMP domain-containing histidine kinase [Gracilimonas mengyeensis]|uniref:histidine kinase n=1 Tax=Gracilimonas mengyeensis TaxID=1302730 RepID=A0A521D755_9BACT|nr:HAMP domain-containing histidine kinase [Gracilimonas mengyeensis]SMO67537.1 hypothetical protein SAMN06265219_107178 [Gracilimonas mengyeensis]